MYDVIYKENIPEQRPINTPEDVFQLLKEIDYINHRQERSILITLDTAKNVIGVHIVHIGSANETFTCGRDIMYKAIMDNAVSIILCHNHPSGLLEPSETDFRMATRMYGVGLLHDIKVILSMVVSKNGFATIRPNVKEIDKFIRSWKNDI
jgi:DNA repair protein RadC